MNKLLAWAGAGVALALVTSLPAWAGAPAPAQPTADEGSTFKAWVGEQVNYNDNIYAIDSVSPVATVISPGATRGDYFNSASVGALGQVSAGRQLFNVAGRFDDNRFDHNDQLNNTAYDLTGIWNWSVGSPFYGTAGGEVSRGLASFSEVRYNGKDLIKANSYFFTSRYQLGPHWALLAETTGLNADHSALSIAYNNFHGRLYTGGIEYSTEVDDTFAFKYNYYQGRYPNNVLPGQCLLGQLPDGTCINGAQVPPGVIYNSNYNEHFPQFWVKYGITDKTVFHGNIGFLRRDYVDAATGTYRGVVWRAYVDWQATDKVSVAFKTYHEVHSYNVSAADYFISTGGSISPTWAATDKFHVAAGVSYDNQRYIPNSLSDNIGYRRNDRVLWEQVDFSYQPRDRWLFNLFFHHERRNSNLRSEFAGETVYPFKYTYDLVNLAVTYKFF